MISSTDSDMATSICQSMNCLSLSRAYVRSPGICSSSLGQCSFQTTGKIGLLSAGRSHTLVIVAAQNSKKRIRTAERNRQYNKAHKSAVATRMKKVLKALDGFKDVKAEEELAPVQQLLSEAYEEIDKAVVKGVLHKNTAARRKSRLAIARRNLLIQSGLYSPAS